MSKTYRLEKPIKYGDDELTELTIEEPNAGQIAELGYPFDMKSNIIPKVVLDYLTKLTALPPSTIKQLSARDFMQLSGVVVSFFGSL